VGVASGPGSGDENGMGRWNGLGGRTVWMLSLLVGSACSEGPGGLPGQAPSSPDVRDGTDVDPTIEPSSCEAPEARVVELTKAGPVSLEGVNLLALPRSWRQAARRAEAPLDSSASTVVVPLFCDGPEAPEDCETGFVIAQKGRAAEFLPGRTHTGQRRHDTALISSDGSVVLKSGNRIRIFDGGIQEDFESPARQVGMTELFPGVVRIVEDFGVRVWTEGALRFIVPDSVRVMDVEPAGDGYYARTRDSDDFELLWIGQSPDGLQVRSLAQANGMIQPRRARVDRNGQPLPDEQLWVCVVNETGTELQLLDPEMGVIDRIRPPEPSCYNRLVHVPGEGLWIAYGISGNDVLYRLSGERVFTARGEVEEIIAGSNGWIISTRSTNENHVYTVTPEGETSFIGSSPFGFDLATEGSVRVAISRHFAGAKTRGVLFVDEDGREPITRTFEKEIASWSLSPSGELWATVRNELTETLFVFPGASEPTRFEGIGLGGAHWIGNEGLLQIRSGDPSTSGLYIARGTELERLFFGRRLSRVDTPAGGDWFSYFIDNPGTTQLAVFENGGLTVVDEAARMRFGRDLQGRTWVEASGLDSLVAHRIDASGLTRNVFGPNGTDELSFFGLAEQGTPEGGALWASVRLELNDEGARPCVCALDDSGCIGAPRSFDTVVRLPTSAPGGPVLMGLVDDRAHIWFDTTRPAGNAQP